MAKTGSKAIGQAAGKSTTAGTVKSFEERLERLETLGEQIRRTDIPLDEALKAFEEGIKLARTLEKDLEKVESKIEILMNSADEAADESDDDSLSDDLPNVGKPTGGNSSTEKSFPELELFEAED